MLFKLIIIFAIFEIALNCELGQYRCYLSGECIDSQLICNGEYDCKYRDDERNCSYNVNSKRGTTGIGQCQPGEYQCKGLMKRCINTENVCDGVYHCPSGDDEVGCHKEENNAHQETNALPNQAPDSVQKIANNDTEKMQSDMYSHDKCPYQKCHYIPPQPCVPQPCIHDTDCPRCERKRCPECPQDPSCPTCPPPGTCPTCPTSASCPVCPTRPTCPTCPPWEACPSCPKAPLCPSCPSIPPCPSCPHIPTCPTCPPWRPCPECHPQPPCPTCQAWVPCKDCPPPPIITETTPRPRPPITTPPTECTPHTPCTRPCPIRCPRPCYGTRCAHSGHSCGGSGGCGGCSGCTGQGCSGGCHGACGGHSSSGCDQQKIYDDYGYMSDGGSKVTEKPNDRKNVTQKTKNEEEDYVRKLERSDQCLKQCLGL